MSTTVQKFERYNATDAPRGSAEILKGAEQKMGFTPNLYAVMAESPALLKGYTELDDIFATSSLTPVERQIILLTVSRFHECHYCVAAHSTLAKSFNIDENNLSALREGRPLHNGKQEALRRFTETLVENRGWLRDDDLQDFLDAGYNRTNVMEVILGIALKTMSNYTNHVVDTDLDKAFAAQRWTPAK